MNKRIDPEFFHRDVLEAAPDLVGKILVHRLPTVRSSASA